MHSRSKEQREAVRQLIYLVLTRDMGTFNPDRFKHWIKETDSKFRKSRSDAEVRNPGSVRLFSDQRDS